MNQPQSFFFPKTFAVRCAAGGSFCPPLTAVHPVSLPSVCKLTNRVAKVVFSVYELQLPTHIPFPYLGDHLKAAIRYHFKTGHRETA
jgi:hypothetical protein